MTDAIPEAGVGRQALEQMLDEMRERDRDHTTKDWNSRSFLYLFHAGDDVRGVAEAAYTKFLKTEALSAEAFPSVQQLQADLVSYVGELLNAGANSGGHITTGGTESIILATMAARNWSRMHRPEVTEPEMVVTRTAHPAFGKAGEVVGVRLVRVPETENFDADVAAMADAIGENTIMLVGSAPTFWHGVIDAIPELGQLAQARNLWLHVDGCMGGLLGPFVRELGYELPDFDFSVPGVRSISADFHKYGFSLKGASILMLREAEDMKYHTFTDEGTYSPYVTPGLVGTRSGAAIASAWAVFNFLGREGFRGAAKSIMRARETLLQGIRATGCLAVRGDPKLSIVSFGSDEMDIFAVAAGLQARGWLPNTFYRPDSLHLRLTPAHEPAMAEFIEDLGRVIDDVRAGVQVRDMERGTYGI